MSRKSEVQIILPFEFRYSDKGGFHTEHAVTVRAPSLPDFAVHNSMVGYAKAAEIGTAVAFSAFRQKMADVVAEDTASDVPEPAETDQEMADRVLGVYATGLGAEKFPALVRRSRLPSLVARCHGIGQPLRRARIASSVRIASALSCLARFKSNLKPSRSSRMTAPSSARSS